MGGNELISPVEPTTKCPGAIFQFGSRPHSKLTSWGKRYQVTREPGRSSGTLSRSTAKTVSEFWLWCLCPPWAVSTSCSHLQEPNLKDHGTWGRGNTHLICSYSVHTKTARVSGRVRRMCKFVKLGHKVTG